MDQADGNRFVDRKYQLETLETQRPNHVRLFFLPLDRFYHQNLDALARIADDLILRKGVSVCRILRNQAGSWTTDLNGTPSVLAACPARQAIERKSPIGVALAHFHRWTSGVDIRLFPESPFFRQTSDWAVWMDRLEKRYLELREKDGLSPFEENFCAYFPYFSGCAENGIQYMVDRSIDFPNREEAVLCHYRFPATGLPSPENPALWVVDDRSRDLADWLRILTWQKGGDAAAAADQFLEDYDRVFPITDSVAAGLFGRLLFPLSFAECCARYFSGGAGENPRFLEETLRMNIEKTADSEVMLRFLGEKYARRIKTPKWLIR
ncbi:hypothetical protein EWH99_03645 [Sporolactobacillus sp. THM7-7]|nr:hypothetical protein EWH99_03645 [Sporolactobacillus sp. THM7-7]